MVEPHTPTSPKGPNSPILDSAFSVDDEVAKTQELFGEMKQPLHKLNDVFDGLHDRTTQMASLTGPVGTNSEIANLRQRLSDVDQKHKDVITDIHGILDELELLRNQYVDNIRKEVERDITEQMGKLVVQERVAELECQCLETHISQEVQDRSNEPPQHQPHPGSQVPTSPRNPPSSLEGPSMSTLAHTITSSVHPANPPALAHSSNSLGLTSPPPTSSTHSISGANLVDVGSRRFVPRTAAKITIKKADGIEVSVENLTKSTPTPSTPAVSSPHNLELRQGSSGSPNRRLTSIGMETEDQQNDRLKAEATDKEEKEKEKTEAERKAKVADEAAWLEKEQIEERLRKEAEALELQHLKEEEEEERKLNLKQETAKVERERKEKEERKEQERLSKLAEETRLRLEEVISAKTKAEAISEPEPEERGKVELEAHKGDGKQDRQLEDGEIISINSHTSDKRRPGPLDLTSAIRSASPAVASLAAARFITDIATVSYPEGYQGPHPDLNQNVKNGKFRYDPEFLLQFMSVCKERPATFPPLDAIGLKPHIRAMSRGGSGIRPSGPGQASVGLGFTHALGAPGANSLFITSEERYANSNRASSLSGVPGMQFTSNPLSTMQGSAISEGGAGAPLQKRVRTKRKVNENIVPGGSGGQGHGSGFYSVMNQMQNLDPVAPLQGSENQWDRNANQNDQDSPELVEQKVKGLLNELTMEKFDSISDQIIAWANMSEKETDGRTLIQVIHLVFEKATDKAARSKIYARLCRKMMEQISTNVQDDGVRNLEGKPITGGHFFRKHLLNRCQEECEREWVAKEVTAAAAAKELEDEVDKAANAKTEEGGTEKIYSDEYYAAQKTKRRRLGLFKFIGELFNLQMLTERIMHECVKMLLGNIDNPEETEIESLCMLLATVGSMLDTPKARGHLDLYFSRIKDIMNSPNVTHRLQHKLKDLLELRERKWVASYDQQSATFPPIIAQMKESYQRQINMSYGGSSRGGDRGEHNHQQVHDGWAVAGSGSGPPRPPTIAGDLSNFGKISKTQPMTFGPSSVFAGKKGAENKREAISQTNSSSNIFSMLSSQGAKAGDKDKVPAAAAATAEPQQRKRIRVVLQPRYVPVDASPAGESESSHSEEEAGIEMTEEAAMKKISEDLKEFFTVRNLEEAEVYFSGLPPQYHHFLVDKIVSTAVESKEDDAKLVSRFFALAVLKELCSAASFEEGLTPVAEIIDDIAIDAPKALQLLAMMVKGARLNQERLFNLASKSLDSDKFLALLK